MRDGKLRELALKLWSDSNFGKSLSSLMGLGLQTSSLLNSSVSGDLTQMIRLDGSIVKNEKKLNTREKKVTACRKIIPKTEHLQGHVQMRDRSECPWGNSERLTDMNPAENTPCKGTVS